MFRSWSQSCKFAKLSFGTLRDHKHLIAFPAISGLATLAVLASFLLPLQMTGTLNTWLATVNAEAGTPKDPTMYVTLFLFYFCNYFAIVFFNTALVASVMDIFEGGQGKLSFGLKFAMKRIHAIFGWALVSAVIGMILKAIERNEKVGRIIAAIIGSAWTALTYFVIPVVVAEGLGPVGAVKSSMHTLKKTWGTALIGNFSMGMIGLLLFIPVFVLWVFLVASVGLLAAIVICIPLGMLVALITSTADAIFQAYLYSYATGKTLPYGVDTHDMQDAFSAR